jgi:hypothetical protein
MSYSAIHYFIRYFRNSVNWFFKNSPPFILRISPMRNPNPIRTLLETVERYDRKINNSC